MPPKKHPKPKKAKSAKEPETTVQPTEQQEPETTVQPTEQQEQEINRKLQPQFELILSESDDDSEIVLFPEEDAKGMATAKVVEVGNFQPSANESDSSDDEATLNRVGDIPLEWYENEDHYGYDIEGQKLLKSEKGALERLLDQVDDPNALRTIHDALHNEKKVLSNADLQMIFNLQRNRTPNAGYDMYEDYSEGMVQFDPLNHPLARPSGPSKKKFVPALHDMKVIAKMVKRLMDAPKAQEEKEEEQGPKLLWDDSANVELDSHTKFKYEHRIPKPKLAPPGTYESYRPPPEYLPSETTKGRFQKLRRIDRQEHFLPQQFAALRHVPFYHHTIQDQYQRCLDLSMFPRAQRTRLVVDPAKLLPDLPDPKDLRPYPERLSFLYKGHTGIVRSISVSPNGQYLATGCDDHLVRIFEVQTGRLMKRYDVGGVVQQVAFNPNKALNILAVAVEYSLLFIIPTFCAHSIVNDHSTKFLKAPLQPQEPQGRSIVQTTIDQDETALEEGRDLDDKQEKEKRAEFVDGSPKERAAGIVAKLTMHAKVKRFTFQCKGDYMCALCPKDPVKYRQTIMVQLSKRQIFCPFRKFAEVVIDCRFHPSQPQFFLATTNTVRCYNLLHHKIQKRFKAQGGITTCLDVHPEGDNFLVGDTTNHTSWYDVDFSSKPYKRMRSHRNVVNAVAYHPTTSAYPIFASGSADGQVHVFHGKVFDDYNRNALIVPVKILKHRRSVYDVAWHPHLPWLFTSTEDGTVSCWTE